LVDHAFRGYTTPIFPTGMYFGLLAITGTWTPSTAYTVGQEIVPATANGRMYVCTAAGTSYTTAPTWPTTPGGTVTETSGPTWKEMTVLLQTGAFAAGSLVEASYGSYARASYAPGATQWTATQGGDSGASTGTTGETQNVAAITFPGPTSAQAGQIGGCFIADGATVGAGNSNVLFTAVLTAPKTINNGDAAPNFPAGAFTLTWS
jgi:hypothetical protein